MEIQCLCSFVRCRCRSLPSSCRSICYIKQETYLFLIALMNFSWKFIGYIGDPQAVLVFSYDGLLLIFR